MTATAAMIAQVRRMVAETSTATYTDQAIQEIIEQHPLLDELGRDPNLWQLLSPPVPYPNPAWMPTYDLNAAAADIWEQKAGTVAPDFDLNADGASLSRSQIFQQYMELSKHFRSRSSIRTARMVKKPDELQNGQRPSWIGNLPEPRD